jgi:predicted ABC-type ATPase
MSEKKILIIAGPNGAGKTTFAREFLPNEAGCPTFVNADLIAAGLSPFSPESAAIKAGRLMLEEMQSHVKKGNSFAIETTVSSLGYVRKIREWRAQRYQIKLYFLALKTEDMAHARVAERVLQGGHHVPSEVISRRFHAGFGNFREVYRNEVDWWRWYDNSDVLSVLIDEGHNFEKPTMKDPDMENATAALIRAGRRARVVAAQTGTACVNMSNGRVCREFPEQEPRADG